MIFRGSRILSVFVLACASFVRASNNWGLPSVTCIDEEERQMGNTTTPIKIDQRSSDMCKVIVVYRALTHALRVVSVTPLRS